MHVPGKEKITFDIPTAANNIAASIVLNTFLPAITDPVSIDGTTQLQGLVEINGNQQVQIISPRKCLQLCY